jgi:2-oxo-4-hydroxy-4-carboxy--5-ureidoimidazoline (OHCU) decarboxylase
MNSPNEVLAQMFEGAPRFVERLAAEPAESWTGLLDRAERIALTMPEDEQLELLGAHPRIGADPAGVSAMSFREQGYDRDPGTAELQARLDRLNDDYEQRFGFRFVIFVNGRARAEIADVLESQLDAEREGEKRRALSDVIAIARHRLVNLGNQARQ